jgi:dTDP-glucose 4,6-dehydratase
MRYAIDAGKLRNELGWLPTYDDFDAGLLQTVEWYRANQAWWRPMKGQTEAKYAAAGEQVTA